MTFYDEDKLKLVEECISETDRLRKKLCTLRDELKTAVKSNSFWYGGAANAAVKRASLDHSKLLRRLR